MKPQTVQIVRQGEATPYWFKFNPLYIRSWTGAFLPWNKYPYRPRPDRQACRKPDRAGASIPVRRSDDLGLVRCERPCCMGRNESKRAAREPREMGARFWSLPVRRQSTKRRIAWVFRRFRSWLKQVYQSLKSLNVELPDEVHRVFDRMFASDEQIQKTQYINGMAPLSDNKA